MKLSIPAWKANKYLSLEEILLAIGDSCKHLYWCLRVFEASTEPGTDALNEVNPEKAMSYSNLLNLVTPKLQIIDGEATAGDGNVSSERRVLIRAVDSTSWDIETNIPDVITKIRQSFPEAEEIKE
ncbi:hypothetical protein [Paraherbaspirillum soli]|uniref:Uncharacterized protein n=1 Tax=Paraherbaspirillum soli TaxID=631222 RepID=A0ABW0M3S5_9BURK